jgi:hypothetical protein
LRHDRQHERTADEQNREHRRRARQHGGAAPGAERGLTRAAAERAGDVAALALLQQNHQHQAEADEHVKNRYQVVQHLRF